MIQIYWLLHTLWGSEYWTADTQNLKISQYLTHKSGSLKNWSGIHVTEGLDLFELLIICIKLLPKFPSKFPFGLIDLKEEGVNFINFYIIVSLQAFY